MYGMGPVPRPGNHPVMPDPVRLIRRSVTSAERELGSAVAARRRILAVAATCRYWLGTGDPAEDWWLDELWQAACAEAKVTMSPTTHRQESDHGDRSTRSGKTAGTAREKGA